MKRSDSPSVISDLYSYDVVKSIIFPLAKWGNQNSNPKENRWTLERREKSAQA